MAKLSERLTLSAKIDQPLYRNELIGIHFIQLCILSTSLSMAYFVNGS